jgi:predicted metal-dependent peptidase
MKAITRLQSARLWLCGEKPFFGYIAMYLKFIEENKIETCAIDKNGNFYYNSKFVESLTKEQLRGVVLHELLHCVFFHLHRLGHRDRMIWNYATDSVINYIIINEGLELPEMAIRPSRYDGSLKIFGKTFSVKNKSAEKFYNEIYEDMKKNMNDQNKNGESGDGDSNDGMKNFDEHKYVGKESKEDSKSNQQKNKNLSEQDWKRIITNAKVSNINQKSKGYESGEMDRLIDDISDPKINWQSKLRQILKGHIPYDYTFTRRNRKTHHLPDTYLPAIEKDKIEVLVNIDTSGSVGKEELTAFVSEVIGIRNAYQNLKLIILYSDTKVYKPVELENPTVEDIIRHKPKGYGGTDHRPVFEYIDKHYPNIQLVVCCTDGQTDFPDKIPRYNVIWVLGGSWKVEKNKIPFGEVIEID